MKNMTTLENNSPKKESFCYTSEFAEILSRSDFVPKAYKGKPGDIIVAIQMGREVGLKPIQAVQSITVINGKPSIWGDAMSALCRSHPDFEDMKESFDFDKDGKLLSATCTVKRKGQTQVTCTFSWNDAVTAGLTNKQGPWKTYPKRMMQMRARGFALRDSFADALQGLISSEEAADYPKNINNKHKIIDVDKIEIEEDAPLATSEQIEKIHYLISSLKIEDAIIKKWLEKDNALTLEEMKKENIQSCIQMLEDKADQDMGI